MLARPRRDHALADLRRGLPRRSRDLLGRGLADRTDDVEAVGERTAQPRLIAAHLVRAAVAAGAVLAAAAGTRVGGGDEHEAAGQHRARSGSGDRDRAALE